MSQGSEGAQRTVGVTPFWRLVREMREAQRAFFASRGKDGAALRKAKALEKQVDEELLRIEALSKTPFQH